MALGKTYHKEYKLINVHQIIQSKIHFNLKIIVPMDEEKDELTKKKRFEKHLFFLKSWKDEKSLLQFTSCNNKVSNEIRF